MDLHKSDQRKVMGKQQKGHLSKPMAKLNKDNATVETEKVSPAVGAAASPLPITPNVEPKPSETRNVRNGDPKGHGKLGPGTVPRKSNVRTLKKVEANAVAKPMTRDHILTLLKKLTKLNSGQAKQLLEWIKVLEPDYKHTYNANGMPTFSFLAFKPETLHHISIFANECLKNLAEQDVQGANGNCEGNDSENGNNA